jgi:hypothetical protein
VFVVEDGVAFWAGRPPDALAAHDQDVVFGQQQRPGEGQGQRRYRPDDRLVRPVDGQAHNDRPQRPAVTGLVWSAAGELEQRVPVVAGAPECLEIVLGADGETHQPVTRRRRGHSGFTPHRQRRHLPTPMIIPIVEPAGHRPIPPLTPTRPPRHTTIRIRRPRGSPADQVSPIGAPGHHPGAAENSAISPGHPVVPQGRTFAEYVRSIADTCLSFDEIEV